MPKRRQNMAKNEVFNSLMKGLSESLEFTKGDTSKARRLSVTVSALPSYQDKEIKGIREELNLSQKNFAFILGVSQKTVEAWETGRNIPQGTAQRILQMLKYGGIKMLQDYKVIALAE